MRPGDLDEIVRRYRLGTSPRLQGPVSRGELGGVFRLETDTGTWALKELIERQEETDAARGADFQDAAVRAGVPAPAVVRTASGAVLLELGSGQYRVSSWVDLSPPEVDLDPGAVGRLVASLHRLGHPAAGPPDPWYTDPVGPDRWQQLFAQLAAAGMPQAGALAGTAPELTALEQILRPPTALQTLHRDLWADNVRVSGAGGLCVIDWDNCGAGEPTMELAAVLFEYCSWDPARARTLHDAYLEAGGPGRVSGPSDFSMAVAQLGHILEWQCRQWLDATTVDRRRHAEAAVAEHLDRPLTRAVVDDLLGAVAG